MQVSQRYCTPEAYHFSPLDSMPRDRGRSPGDAAARRRALIREGAGSGGGRTWPSSAALHGKMTAWERGCKAYHRRHIASATPPIRAPAFDGHAKAAPYPGPDDELRRRPKGVHLRATISPHKRSGEFTSPYGGVRPPRKWRGKPAATKEALDREMAAWERGCKAYRGGMSRRRRHRSEHPRLRAIRMLLRTRRQMTSRGGVQSTSISELSVEGRR